MKPLALLFCSIIVIAAPAAEKHDFTAGERAWWAVQPVRNPAPPDSGEGWARNEIDRFISRKLEQAGLEPAPEAGRQELVRRATFDLHGLPPTPEQVEGFLNDREPGAWERLIQSLLDSPRYGEHWAQHWLDVVRYAESDGYRQDAFRPEAHHYRDYVIKSLNEDKPYNQFVREQLAGDELDPGNPEHLTATGFLRHGIYEYNQRNARMHWELIMNEMTSVTGEVFLGLGVGCAQCHDHKFDPILQKDFYALQAFLGTTAWPTDTQLATPEEQREHRRQQEVWETTTREIRDELNSILEANHQKQSRYAVEQFPEDIQKIYHKPRAERTPYEQQLVMLVDRQVDWQIDSVKADQALKGKPDQLKRYKELEARLKEFDHLKPKPLPKAFAATDVSARAAKTFIPSRKGREEVEPAFPSLLNQKPPAITPSEETTGRRSALAQWIADEDNQLSTRVIANRLWQYHFGQGIVATPNDFGTLGEPPSHPDLLDWLTRRFIAGGWRMKEIHALIMNSATYRQTARWEPGTVQRETDPGNRLLWRFPPRRLEAEEVRDAMLAVSGELKHQEGGPSEDNNSPRRSVYVKKLRNTPDPVLHAFDSPAGFESTPTRIPTTTPTQSLLLVNGEWTLSRARAFARRVSTSGGPLAEGQIEQAYLLAYNRKPGPEETARALAFLRHQETGLPSSGPTPTLDAMVDFCHALLNSNEFLYLH